MDEVASSSSYTTLVTLMNPITRTICRKHIVRSHHGHNPPIVPGQFASFPSAFASRPTALPQ